MNKSTPEPSGGAVKDCCQAQVIRLINAFFDDECITDVVKHLNLVCADAIALTDAENEPFHDHFQKVAIVVLNSKIVNLLTELNFYAKRV